MYYLFMMTFIFALMALILVWQSIGYFRRMRLWKRIRATPLPPGYAEILQRIPHYRRLPEDLKSKIHDSIRFFIATKEFRPVDLTLSEEMQVVIAFYACLLQLGREDCFEGLHTIVIYPNDVITHRIEASGGIFTRGEFLLEGESAGGTVVVAWNEARREVYHPGKHNVIVHELAHELDYEDGAADGVPPLDRSRYYAWTQVMFKNYTRLAEHFRKGRYLEKYSLIGPYAATNEAEFFAVVSELFFEKPKSLKKHFPDIYRELEAFYGLDTAELFGDLS